MNDGFHLVNTLYDMDTYIFSVNVFLDGLSRHKTGSIVYA